MPPRRPIEPGKAKRRTFQLIFDSPEQRRDAHDAARARGCATLSPYILRCIAPDIVAAIPEARERWAAYLPEEPPP
jgi:hypothetical protein